MLVMGLTSSGWFQMTFSASASETTALRTALRGSGGCEPTGGADFFLEVRDSPRLRLDQVLLSLHCPSAHRIKIWTLLLTCPKRTRRMDPCHLLRLHSLPDSPLWPMQSSSQISQTPCPLLCVLSPPLCQEGSFPTSPLLSHAQVAPCPHLQHSG